MSKFQEYVTNQAFALTLSRRMCETLEFVARMDLHPEGYKSLGVIPGLSSVHALEERGLIEPGPWHLTEAGNLLYALLTHCSLVKSKEELRAEIYKYFGAAAAHASIGR